VESGGDEFSVADVRKMIRIFNELKEDTQKQLNESQEKMDKKLKTQEDTEMTKPTQNKISPNQNEAKEIIKKRNMK
jgi:hypothetical protein